MKVAAQIRHRLASCITMLALAAVPCFAQNHRNDSRPRPSRQEPSRSQPRPSRPQFQPRYQSRPERDYSAPRNYQSRPPQNYGSRPRGNYPPPPRQNYQAPPRNYPPAPRYDVPRPYQPPAQGHHSGQWLNRYRGAPLEQQRRVLENDPTFRRKSVV